MAEPAPALFLTGGSRGLGARLVTDAAAAGYDVAFTYFDDADAASALVEELERSAPKARIHAYQLDVRDSAAVDEVVQSATDDFEDISLVVCNAGITRSGLLFSMSDTDWRDVIDTNLTGAFHVVRAFLPHFLARRSGRFVHVSSVAMYGMAGQAGYCASKAGLTGLSAAISKEYGPKGITSNVIALGLFAGGMADSDASERTVSFWNEFCPAGRPGDPAEVFRAVAFLGSPESGFITGEVLHLAGGLAHTP